MGSKSETSLSRELRPTKERSADLLMLRTRYTLHQPGLAPPETRVRSGLGEPSNPRRLYQLRVRNDADDESHRLPVGTQLAQLRSRYGAPTPRPAHGRGDGPRGWMK